MNEKEEVVEESGKEEDKASSSSEQQQQQSSSEKTTTATAAASNGTTTTTSEAATAAPPVVAATASSTTTKDDDDEKKKKNGNNDGGGSDDKKKNPKKLLLLSQYYIKQLWVDTRQYPGGKLEFLSDVYSLLTVAQSIVFVATKRQADAVHETLAAAGFTCSVLHGGVDTAAMRDETMDQFRRGEANVLITTNVLAQGVDVDNVGLVVNYDVPVDVPVDIDDNPDYETYLHRIGRPGGRFFGRKGTAINLVDDMQSVQVLAAIEQYFFSRDGKEMIQKAEADPEALVDKIEFFEGLGLVVGFMARVGGLG